MSLYSGCFIFSFIVHMEVLAFINVSIVTYLSMLKMRHSYQNFCAASVPKSFALQVLKSKEV